MSKTSARMTIQGKPPSFVVADSTLELKIKDLKEVLGGKTVSDKIQLMELSDASWTVTMEKDKEPARSEYTYVHADLHGFPKELKSKSQAVLSVSCEGQALNGFMFSSGSFKAARISLYSSNSTFGKLSKNNSITLSCHLVITCEGVSSLRKKFYDPQECKKSILGSVANLLGDPTFADFAFIVGAQEFKVHMNILAAASPVMRRMFTSDLEEARTKRCTVDAIDPEIFAHLLRFIYNAEIPENLEKIAVPLYEAAHYYEIECINQICAQEIHESLTPSNALRVFEWAQLFDLLEDLKLDAWLIIKRDILKIFVKLKNEPLSLEEINAIIKQRRQEKAFWEKHEEEVVAKAE